MSDFPVPTLVRLEYLTPTGWAVGHRAMNLLHPARYVERLAARGKIGRATELDDQLQPTGTVWQPDELPDPAQLVPSDTPIPRLACSFCGAGGHPEGRCLI